MRGKPHSKSRVCWAPLERALSTRSKILWVAQGDLGTPEGFIKSSCSSGTWRGAAAASSGLKRRLTRSTPRTASPSSRGEFLAEWK